MNDNSTAKDILVDQYTFDQLKGIASATTSNPSELLKIMGIDHKGFCDFVREMSLDDDPELASILTILESEGSSSSFFGSLARLWNQAIDAANVIDFRPAIDLALKFNTDVFGNLAQVAELFQNQMKSVIMTASQESILYADNMNRFQQDLLDFNTGSWKFLTSSFDEASRKWTSLLCSFAC